MTGLWVYIYMWKFGCISSLPLTEKKHLVMSFFPFHRQQSTQQSKLLPVTAKGKSETGFWGPPKMYSRCTLNTGDAFW